MIADLKPYPEYKESGIPWIGSVPRDWRVERTKCIFRSKKELNVGRQNTNVLSLTLRGVVNNDPESPEGMVPKDYATYQLFKKHDLVFKLIDLENIRTSRVGLVHEDGIMSSAYVRLAPTKSVNIRFFYLQFFDLYTRAVFNALGAGVRSTLGSADLGEVRIVIPPPDEQATIVRFLDHWNGRLEKAIRAKRRVIALLQEQKQAIIHRAVTRGLDPKVPLKDSGIPWLGDIPAHWEVYRLSFLADFSNGKAHEQFFDSEGEFVCVNARFVSTSGTGIKYCTQNFWPARRGDVLMVMSDLPNGRALARAYLVNDDRKYAVNQRVCRLRSKRVEAGFLAYAANRNYGLLRHDDGSNQTHLSTGDYKTLPIQCPPAAEQQAIVRYLDAHVSKADVLVASLEREITLLREYRTRLTADVVTGKLDVRAAAAQLPDPEQAPSEPEEPEEETELEEVEG